MRELLHLCAVPLLTPMETEMSDIFKDRRRRVSEPTEADFIRGFAQKAAGKGHSQTVGILTAVLAASLIGKALRRGL